MKKFFLALLVALCGFVSLFADDIADVKAVIIREFELAAKRDFAGVLALRATDFQHITQYGETYGYDQVKWMLLALDGKHPREYLLFGVFMRSGGDLPAQELYTKTLSPELLKTYEKMWPKLAADFADSAKFMLKTLKFVSVTVDGDKAVVVIEYDSKGEMLWEVYHFIETVCLRKVNGKWLMYRCIVKNK